MPALPAHLDRALRWVAYKQRNSATHTERIVMNADADGLVAIPTLDTSHLAVDSRGNIINKQDCCIVCYTHPPNHCHTCHPGHR